MTPDKYLWCHAISANSVKKCWWMFSEICKIRKTVTHRKFTKWCEELQNLNLDWCKNASIVFISKKWCKIIFHCTVAIAKVGFGRNEDGHLYSASPLFAQNSLRVINDNEHMCTPYLKPRNEQPCKHQTSPRTAPWTSPGTCTTPVNRLVDD